MGMDKERDKTKVDAAGAGGEIGDKHNEGHCDVPRSRALVRDNTLTPACMTMSNNSLYNGAP